MGDEPVIPHVVRPEEQSWVERDDEQFLCHTRAQAEAGKVKAPGKRIPHYGRTTKDYPHQPHPETA